MSDHDLALDAHAAHDMAVLPVSVRGLVLVHEVHIDRVVRDLLVELCVEVHQRLPVLLQPQDPGLRRRERMHPCDDASALLVSVRLIKGLSDHRVCDQRRLPYDLIRQQTGLVEPLHDDPGVLCHIL